MTIPVENFLSSPEKYAGAIILSPEGAALYNKLIAQQAYDEYVASKLAEAEKNYDPKKLLDGKTVMKNIREKYGL